MREERELENIQSFLKEKPSKLYFDLEYDIAANPTINSSQLMNNFIQVNSNRHC